MVANELVYTPILALQDYRIRPVHPPAPSTITVSRPIGINDPHAHAVKIVPVDTCRIQCSSIKLSSQWDLG